MTDDVVQRARQALNGITPGPWEIDQDWALVAHGSDSVVHVHMDECPCGERTVADVEVLASTEDLTFIAATPQLVADLAAEVEQLWVWKREALTVMAGLQDLGKALGVPLGHRITGPDATERAQALVAEVEKLRGERDKAESALRAVDRIANSDNDANDDEDPHPDDVVERVRILAAERDDYGDDYATASQECDEARRLLGRDVQEILTEVDAMRGRLNKRIDDLSQSSESYRVQAFGKASAEQERDRLRATIARVRELADDIANGCLSCGSPSGGDNLADTILRALDGEVQ